MSKAGIWITVAISTSFWSFNREKEAPGKGTASPNAGGKPDRQKSVLFPEPSVNVTIHFGRFKCGRTKPPPD